MQPKRYQNAKIALLNIELELKAEKENAEIRLESVEVLVLPRRLLYSLVIPWNKPCHGINHLSASIGIPESGGRRVEDPLRETRGATCSGRSGSAEQIANRRRGHSVVRGSRHVLRWSRARRGPAPNSEGMRRRSADNGAGPAR